MNQNSGLLPQLVSLPEEQRNSYLQAFMLKNKQDLVKSVQLENTKATIVPDSEEHLPILGEMIRNGQLVSFPTETVYGLGGDATNEKALLEIYRVKKRPLSDPIIVHVLGFDDALNYVKIQSDQEKELFKELTEQFWPGPLTVILKANLDKLPAVVTAQTGFVGIRSPKAPMARKLIEESQRPIGAPSANLFSHVSPTSACHVFNDFFDQSVTIIDGQICEYGVESTVVKIVDRNLQILREGSFSVKKLTEFVKNKFGQTVSITINKKTNKKEDNENMEAPGQLLKHYAPYLPCYYVDMETLRNSEQSYITESVKDREVPFAEATLISFSEEFLPYNTAFKHYLEPGQNDTEMQLDEEDKFCTGEEKKKMRSLYSLLRKAENLDTSAILIGWSEQKSGTLWDKIFRATQGNQAIIH